MSFTSKITIRKQDKINFWYLTLPRFLHMSFSFASEFRMARLDQNLSPLRLYIFFAQNPMQSYENEFLGISMILAIIVRLTSLQSALCTTKIAAHFAGTPCYTAVHLIVSSQANCPLLCSALAAFLEKYVAIMPNRRNYAYYRPTLHRWHRLHFWIT